MTYLLLYRRPEQTILYSELMYYMLVGEEKEL